MPRAPSRRFPTVIRRVPLVLCLLAGLAATPLLDTAAGAAGHPLGHVRSAKQSTFDHSVVVKGWAFDPARPSKSVTVKFYVGHRYVGRAAAKSASPTVDKKYKISGKHAYRVRLSLHSTIKTITTRSTGTKTGHGTTLDSLSVTRSKQSVSARIISIAKRYVGKARYVDGGETPKHGFDCSGYTKYVYAKAKVRKLPHNAEAQRHVKGMHVVSAKHARPGDLVFYLSSGNAFHVAIYAGHHKQYAAATPHDGIRYQAVWSSAVEYRTLRR